jgi:peptide deformylase
MRYIDKIKAFYPLEKWKDNKILRAWGSLITEFDDELAEFSEILMDLMWEYDWVGLAAPQLWRNINMIATTQRKKMPTSKNPEKDFIWETLLINPKILDKSKEMQRSEEACLSIPGEQGFVRRHKRVIVSYQDIKWREREQKYVGFNASVVQHEIDHLAWILFTDKLIKD